MSLSARARARRAPAGGSVRDVAALARHATFTYPSGGFHYWMAFGPGGTTLATSNGNGTIYVRSG
jgi:hypothetical protein